MSKQSAKMVILLELIAPVEEEDSMLSREERDGIKQGWDKKLPWNEVFLCVKDEQYRDRLIQLFEKLEEPEDE